MIVGYYEIFKRELNVKKALLCILLISVILIVSSCGGGGGSSGSSTRGYRISINGRSIQFKIDNASDNYTISETNPPSKITIDFEVSTKSPQYHIGLFLSRDADLSSDDYEFYQAYVDNSRGLVEVVLDNQTQEYQNLISYYGGKYYIIVKASTNSHSSWAAASSQIILKKLWTFAVYMDADNSLNSIAGLNIAQMENVGSNKDVNVIVEQDGLYTAAGRYFIKRFEKEKLENLGELDMAQTSTLADFGKWVKNDFPAEHYLIVIWDHGLGFESVNPKSLSRDLLQDETNSDIMSVPNFASAMDNISGILGKKIDILGIDACLMNMVEVAYEIKDCADILVSSENSEPADGWPYDDIVAYMENYPNSNSQTIAKKIVEYYASFYSNYSQPTTQSAIDLSKISNLAKSIDELAKSILNSWDNSSVSSTIKNYADSDTLLQRFNVGNSDYSYADLGNLCSALSANDNMTADIKSAAQNVFDNLSQAVIANGYNGYGADKIYGLTIWFCNPTVYSEQSYYYNRLNFAKTTNWDELLDNVSNN